MCLQLSLPIIVFHIALQTVTTCGNITVSYSKLEERLVENFVN